MDNLDKAKIAADLGAQAAQGISESGLENAKATAVTQKVGLGLSLASMFMSMIQSAKALFSKK